MDPTAVTALATAGAALLAAGGGVVFGQRGSKVNLADVEQRIAASLLTSVEGRLGRAEKRISELEHKVKELEGIRDGLALRVRELETELAVARAELAQVTAERDGLLDRISILTPPNT